MIKKQEPLTPEQVREHTIRAGHKPFLVCRKHIDTHKDHKFLVFAENGWEAMQKIDAKFNIPGAGFVRPIDVSYICGEILEITELS